jgi:hypothetical protein
MSKKPLVPNKNPKGRGKGMGNAGKAAKATKATKAPRKTRICRRLSKGMLTILIAEVDSIAKGFKRFKGGGTDDDDYYKRINGLFSDKNKEAIKRLKEDLVNNILGTMTEGLEDLVIPDNADSSTGGMKYSIANFIDIIINVDNLEQNCIDNIIHISKFISKLQKLPYIDKISTLVMINMLKRVYNLKFKDEPINDENMKFIYLKTTRDLINKITAEYLKKIDKIKLKDLTEDVKRELEYYNYIYILNDYDATKDDDNDAKKIEEIIKWMKDKCKEIENNEFKSFIKNPILIRNDFVTGCKNNSVLNEAIDNYNNIIEDIRKLYLSLDVFPKKEGDIPKYNKFINNNNTITAPEIVELLSANGLLYSGNLYELYKYIIQFEDIMKLFHSMKEKYIERVKVFYDKKIIAEYELKNTLDEQDRNRYTAANIPDNIIRGLESAVSRINENYGIIYQLQEKSNNPDFYKNIPIDIGEIVSILDKLCAYNDVYIYNENEILQELNKFIEKKQSSIKDELYNINKILKDITNKLSYATTKPIKEDLNQKKILVTARQTQLEKELKELENKIKGNTIERIGGGKLTTKYISTGDFVYILYEKKKIKRCVYTKAKGRGKYCKIKGDYILLSKLKVV